MDPKFVDMEHLPTATIKKLWPYLGQADVKKVLHAGDGTIDAFFGKL